VIAGFAGEEVKAMPGDRGTLHARDLLPQMVDPTAFERAAQGELDGVAGEADMALLRRDALLPAWRAWLLERKLSLERDVARLGAELDQWGDAYWTTRDRAEPHAAAGWDRLRGKVEGAIRRRQRLLLALERRLALLKTLIKEANRRRSAEEDAERGALSLARYLAGWRDALDCVEEQLGPRDAPGADALLAALRHARARHAARVSAWEARLRGGSAQPEEPAPQAWPRREPTA